jgi:hypothetical protein
MREVFFVIGRRGAVLWSDAGDSAAALPDRRERWDAIWRLRDEIEELAHSHPAGPLGFSHEDETTMQALAVGLGRDLCFSVVAPNGTIRRFMPSQTGGDVHVGLSDEPWWASLLRRASGMSHDKGDEEWRS